MLTGVAPDLTYTPKADFFGADSFTFSASDGDLTSGEATIAIDVTGVNDAPVATAGVAATSEDTLATITLTGSDVENDPLTFTVGTAPANGVLTGVAPDLTYTPNADFFGADSFTFSASDGDLTSGEATIAIDVTGVNDAPVATAGVAATSEDTLATITLTGSDVENDPLTFTVGTAPANGVLTGVAPDLTYTPNADFFGVDSFTFTASDEDLTSGEATIAIDVTGVNDAPVATAGVAATSEDTLATITLTGSDVENDPLTFTVGTAPANGVLTGVAPDLTYTPNADFFGADSFTFSASDGDLTSGEATIAIDVTGVNDAPAATAGVAATSEDTSATITLTGSDVENDPLTFTVGTAPANGVLTGVAPDLTYTPNADFFGADSFTFSASDGDLTSGEATIAIDVTGVNDAPAATAGVAATSEDTLATITLTGSDVENDPLTFTVGTAPANGVLTGVAPDLTYTPNADFFGADSFTFSASDGDLTSGEATIAIDVTGVNDAPAATAGVAATSEDTSATITLTGSDVENDPLTFTVGTAPANGVLTGVAPDLTYTPNADFFGADSFTFSASDGDLTSGEATIAIDVTGVNDAPVATAGVAATSEDTLATITLTGSDVENDPLTFTVGTAPANGVLTGVAPDLTYTPNADFFGADSFTFSASDGDLTSGEATIAIDVTGVNDAPAATAGVAATSEDTSATITLTGSDVENDPLTFTVGTAPANGVLTGVAPDLTYTPNADFFGVDSFTFSASDGDLTSGEATIAIDVTGVNDAPVATAGVAATSEDTLATITLTGSDVENDPLTFTVGTAPANGVLTGVAPDLTYTPNADFFGADSFTFSASDGDLTSGEATIAIDVTGVNDAPTASPQSLTTPEQSPLDIVLVGNDVEGDTLTFTVVSQPLNGILAGVAPNLTYTANATSLAPIASRSR